MPQMSISNPSVSDPVRNELVKKLHQVLATGASSKQLEEIFILSLGAESRGKQVIEGRKPLLGQKPITYVVKGENDLRVIDRRYPTTSAGFVLGQVSDAERRQAFLRKEILNSGPLNSGPFISTYDAHKVLAAQKELRRIKSYSSTKLGANFLFDWVRLPNHASKFSFAVTRDYSMVPTAKALEGILANRSHRDSSKTKGWLESYYIANKDLLGEVKKSDRVKIAAIYNTYGMSHLAAKILSAKPLPEAEKKLGFVVTTDTNLADGKYAPQKCEYRFDSTGKPLTENDKLADPFISVERSKVDRYIYSKDKHGEFTPNTHLTFPLDNTNKRPIDHSFMGFEVVESELMDVLNVDRPDVKQANLDLAQYDRQKREQQNNPLSGLSMPSVASFV